MSMRYITTINGVEHETDTRIEAIALLRDVAEIHQADWEMNLLRAGSVTMEIGPDTFSIVDRLFSEAKWAQKVASDLYAKDGELEIDSDRPVIRTEDGWRVNCWVWVDAAAAGCDDLDEEADEDNVEAAYVAAAEHPHADFDEDSEASLGDDPGAYVSGWVDVSDGDCEKTFMYTVIVACAKPDGSPFLYTAHVETTKDDFDQGHHIDLAVDQAQKEGYGEAFVCFDHTQASMMEMAADQLAEDSGKTPSKAYMANDMQAPQDFKVTVEKNIACDSIEMDVRAVSVEVARDIAIDRAADMDFEESEGQIRTRVRLAEGL